MELRRRVPSFQIQYRFLVALFLVHLATDTVRLSLGRALHSTQNTEQLSALLMRREKPEDSDDHASSIANDVPSPGVSKRLWQLSGQQRSIVRFAFSSAAAHLGSRTECRPAGRDHVCEVLDCEVSLSRHPGLPGSQLVQLLFAVRDVEFLHSGVKRRRL